VDALAALTGSRAPVDAAVTTASAMETARLVM
jgi:hypothetical protein